MSGPTEPTGKQQHVINGVLHPLCFHQAEPDATDLDSHLYGELNFETVIKFLCIPTLDHSIDAIVQRYREVSAGEPQLVIAPAEERILNKLVWPLRYAKASYMTGNFLGTVALCGMVSEMVAIAMFEIRDMKFGERPLDESFQQELFGSSFERLGQERRIKVLEALEITSGTDLKQHFETIRLTRRKHLHLWSHDLKSLPDDARIMYQSAITLVSTFLGVQIDGWAVKMHPLITKYLAERGELMPAPTEPKPDTTEPKPDSE